MAVNYPALSSSINSRNVPVSMSENITKYGSIYFVYRDGHGLGSMTIHLAHHCFSFNVWWI